MATSVRSIGTFSFSNSATTDFDELENSLSVTIKTDRLLMRSVTIEDCDSYCKLYGDSETVATFSNGKPKTVEHIKSTFTNVWLYRWKNRDPYSAFAVFDKNTNEFLGHACLGHSESGQSVSELAFLLKPSCEISVSCEVVAALVHDYALKTLEKGYLLDGAPLHTVIATALVDCKLRNTPLIEAGMIYACTRERSGQLKNFYFYHYHAHFEKALLKTEKVCF